MEITSPDGHSLELRESVLVAGEFSGKRHDDSVVDPDPEDNADGVEEGETGRGDLEIGAHVEVRCVALGGQIICPFDYTLVNIMPVAKIGSNLMMDLSSSTWVTVQSLQGSIEPLIRSDWVSTAALSKQLRGKKIALLDDILQL
ncbi:peptide transporter 1 [Actinidia rufa]|uniref:Peptide transporter 1 n=1 Tax=Actinidia rufa TaxID=165716 RepID=A0A7J0EB77_9ERIC|nr:peptide transporter 1 [Actinidia rufa]